MTIQEESLQLHYEKKGKIEVVPTVEVQDSKDLSLAYTPGVAEPCLKIQENPELSFSLTRRWNLVAVVTDGSALCCGLGVSVPRPECQSWRENASSLRPSETSTLFRFASKARMWMRSSIPYA